MNFKKILIYSLIIIGTFLITMILISGNEKEKSLITHLSVEEPIISNQNVSLVVMVPGGLSNWTGENFEKAYLTAKNSGIKISFIYYNWKDIEKNKGQYNWGGLDYNLELIKKNNLKSSLVIKLIDTNQIGELPKDIKYKSFKEIELRKRFKNFIIKLLDRYQGEIDYLWIGNEIDDYFYNHRDEFEGYNGLYQELYKEIKNNYPQIKIGTISTFHDAKKNNALDLIEDIGKHGDLIGFSLYPQILGKEPTDTEELFVDIKNISKKINKKFVITETAWSNNEYNGTEEKQVKYLQELFKSYKNHKDKIEYMGLFALYDFSDEMNKMIANSMGIENKEFIKWQGSLGLAYNNGTPKKAWITLLEEMKK